VWRGVLAALMVVALIACGARGDGKLFSRLEAAVTIPDQDAFIAFDPTTRTQTLIVQTRMAGRGEEFAWVVPVPGGLDASRPEAPAVFAVGEGFFPSLRWAFRPMVVNDQIGPAVLLVPMGLVLSVMFLLRGRPRVIGMLSIVVLVAPILLPPMLGRARASAMGGPGVEVLGEASVGLYETVTVASKDAGALGAWLKQRGYVLPDGAGPVLEDYTRRGWVFVCSRLRRGGAEGGDRGEGANVSSLHPLGMRFRTGEAVYPMALTGVGNGPIGVELYVFGPGLARAAGFEVVRCSKPELMRGEGELLAVWRDERLRLGHPDIVAQAEGHAWASKLRATLLPRQQGRDVRIAFSDDGLALGQTLYTPGAVAYRAFAAGLTAFTLAILAACVWSTFADPAGPVRAAVFAATLGAGVLVGGYVHAWTPVAAELVRGRGMFVQWSQPQVLGVELAQEVDARVRAGAMPRVDAASVRRVIEELGERFRALAPENRRELDVPGGYRLVEVPGGVDVWMFDAVGRPTRVSELRRETP
jgi:hypothetical protein